MAARSRTPSPATRVLSALLSAGDPGARDRVRAILTGARTLDEAADELGVSWRTAARWGRLLGVRRPLGRPDLRRTAPVA